jgi:Na+/phosphate symporter
MFFVDQAAFKFTEISLSLSPKFWDEKCVPICLLILHALRSYNQLTQGLHKIIQDLQRIIQEQHMITEDQYKITQGLHKVTQDLFKII